jgi:selenocysteine lyase/cysteine desulfurase
VPTIEQHVLGLARAFTAGLLKLGLPVMRGKVDKHFSHVVLVGKPDPTAADKARFQAIYDHLAANHVKLSIRHDRLRFAFHFYNTPEEVEKVLALLRAKIAKPS